MERVLGPITVSSTLCLRQANAMSKGLPLAPMVYGLTHLNHMAILAMMTTR